MFKVLQGFEIQKLYKKTGKRKYRINLIPDSFFIEKNVNYQKLYKELTIKMKESIIKLGNTEIKTSDYYQLEERRKNLIRDECFDLKWQLEHYNNDIILKRFYQIEVDDEDCSDNDLLA
jgi:hypothetical protein